MTAALGMTAAVPLAAQSPAPRIPLAPGLVFVQSLRMPEGDRESLVLVDDVSAKGVSYVWKFLEVHTSGDTIRDQVLIDISSSDLANAPRWLEVREANEPPEHAGYTSFSSTATYKRLADEGTTTYQIGRSHPAVTTAKPRRWALRAPGRSSRCGVAHPARRGSRAVSGSSERARAGARAARAASSLPTARPRGR
jgi:hypothetical protein